MAAACLATFLSPEAMPLIINLCSSTDSRARPGRLSVAARYSRLISLTALRTCSSRSFPQMAAMVVKGVCLAIPNVDISENEDGYRLSFEIPGTMKDDVKIWVENDLLIVSGEKKNNLGKDDIRVHSERSYGKFERSFRLPKNADREKVKADFVNGVLEVTIPKTEEAKPKQIEIKVM